MVASASAGGVVSGLLIANRLGNDDVHRLEQKVQLVTGAFDCLEEAADLPLRDRQRRLDAQHARIGPRHLRVDAVARTLSTCRHQQLGRQHHRQYQCGNIFILVSSSPIGNGTLAAINGPLLINAGPGIASM